MTSYLFVVRVPVEKDPENVKGIVKPENKSLETPDQCFKAVTDLDGKGENQADLILLPGSESQSQLSDCRDNDSKNIGKSKSGNSVASMDNESKKYGAGMETVAVESNGEQTQNAVKKNASSVSLSKNANNDKVSNKKEDLSADKEQSTKEVSASSDKEQSTKEGSASSGKQNNENRFTVEPAVEFDLLSNSEVGGVGTKPPISNDTVNSVAGKFIVESVSTPEHKETNAILNPDKSDCTVAETEGKSNSIPETVLTNENEKPISEDNNSNSVLKNVGTNDPANVVAESPDQENKNEEKHEVVFFLPKETLLQSVVNILKDFRVENVTISKTNNGQCHQVVFIDEGGAKCEDILNKLADEGIGDKSRTSIRGVKDDQSADEFDDEGEQSEENNKKESEFKKSIKARMLVTEVVNSVRGNAEFTFDYLLFVILASIIAATGLVENSSVVLVASMLISPLMGSDFAFGWGHPCFTNTFLVLSGPILAGTFGTVVRNNSLRNTGLKSESLGLGICLFTGFIFGLISGAVGLRGAMWGSSDTWPTAEMSSRGKLRSLWVGVLIALPSGAGVALSVLGGNTGSLVGVAISASLLPPAVNAGMLWAYALLAGIMPPETLWSSSQNITLNNTYASTACPPFIDNKYIPVYDCSMAKEAGYLGLVSLSLTLVNIFCIFIVAIFVLKIKEVAPQTSVSNEARKFWAEDIQIARDSYARHTGSQSLTQQAKEFLENWRHEKGYEPIHMLKFKDMIEEVEMSDEVKVILAQISNKAKPFSAPLKEDFQKAQEDVAMEVMSDQGFINQQSVYNTIHGIPLGTAAILSPIRIFPRRSSSLVRRNSKRTTVSMVNEVSKPKRNIELKSDLFNRRKNEGKTVQFDSNSKRSSSVTDLSNVKSPLIQGEVIQDTHM